MWTKQKTWLSVVVLSGLLLAGSASLARPDSPPVAASTKAAAIETGIASYYADKYHGRTTANGEVFDTTQLTAAHRTLPFGTRVKVTHQDNQRSVIVRINDRGPCVAGRIIDLSRAAARELGMEKAGLAKVRVDILPSTATVSSR